jgi:glycosyltransferase involved in cell wall biosynthesis
VVCLVSGHASQDIASNTHARVIEVDTPSRLRRFVRIWRIARQVRPQIVHNHACWYGLIAGFLVGAKRVETIHNTYDWFTWYERIHYGLYCLLADRLIAVSDYVRDFTVESFPFMNAKKFVVIHNGVDHGKFSEDFHPEELRKELGIDPARIVIGFVGRLVEQKGVGYLLQAARLLSSIYTDLQFVIVGDGGLRQQLEAQAAQSGLSNVLFVGYQRDIPPYMQMFDVFVLPSLWEGLPVSALEAMAAARPVVATRVSGTSEVVVEGVTGFLVEPRNAEQLEDRLARLIEDANLRTLMGTAGRKRVIENFSARSMVAKTEQLYNELLGEA